MKKTKEKKGLKTGIVAGVLAITTLCMVSGTLAKYVETATGTDTARVAKFAYTINGETGTTVTLDLFSVGTGHGLLDKLSGSEDIIAPGSTDNVDVVFENKGEVKVKVIYAFTETNEGNIPMVYKYNDKYYSSQVSVGNYVKLHQNDTSVVKIDGNLSAMSTAMGTATSNEITANDGTANAKYTAPIEWFWAYEETDSTGATITASRDTSDTALGKAGTAKVTLGVTFTVTQLDK